MRIRDLHLSNIGTQFAYVSCVRTLWEQFGNWWCQAFHANTSWPRTNRYVCLTCGRVWLIPWSNEVRYAVAPTDGWQYSHASALVATDVSAEKGAGKNKQTRIATVAGKKASAGLTLVDGSVHRRRRRKDARRKSSMPVEIFHSGTA